MFAKKDNLGPATATGDHYELTTATTQSTLSEAGLDHVSPTKPTGAAYTIEEVHLADAKSEKAPEPAKKSFFNRVLPRREEKYTPTPERESSSFLAQWTFSYMDEMVGRGMRRTVSASEFPSVERADESEQLSTRLLDAWSVEQNSRGPNAKLWRAAYKVFGPCYLLAGIAYFGESCAKLGQGISLGYILKWFQNPAGESPEGLLLALALSGCVITHAVLHHVVFFLGDRYGMQMRVAFIAAIYRKCLNLSVSNTSSTGLIVNLVSNDVQRFEDAAPFAWYVVLAPVEMAMALYFMWIQISWAAFVALGALLLVLPMQGAFAAKFAALRKAVVVFRDERIKSISDVLAGIMVVKLYAWEIPFVSKITKLRELELDSVKTAAILRAVNEALYFCSSGITALAGFGTYFLMGGSLTSAKVFTCLTYLSNVRLTVTNFVPKAIQFISESWISLQRLEAFLSLPEIGQSYATKDQLAFLDTLDDESIVVAIRDGHFAWESGITSLDTKAKDGDVVRAAPPPMELLKGINLTIRKGQVLGVCGPVGAGKSSLTNAILGEMFAMPGTQIGLRTRKIAYAAQAPWLVTGSIKHNITFGLPYDPEWFSEVVTAAAMDRDVARFENGIETIIGERGVTLSGGQRARLALARAVYQNADLVILDDPLSAVDPHVGRHIFDECIRRVLKHKAVLLITHQLQYVKDCDQVVVMESGRIVGEGTPDHVIRDLTSIFATALREFAERPAGMDQAVDEEDDFDLPVVATADVKVAENNPAAAAKASATGEITTETLTEGSISGKTYYRYFSSGSSGFLMIALLISLVLGEAVADGANYWLAHWSQSSPAHKSLASNAWIFLALVCMTVVIANARALLFFFLTWRAGRILFLDMVSCVFKVEMGFFQQNPHGRLLNRFSKDINLLDEMLPQTFFDFIQCFFMILGTLVISLVVIPYTLVLVPFIGVSFYILRTAYIETSRQLKRIEAITRSPVYSNISSTIEGLSTVRAMAQQEAFKANFVKLLNDNTAKYFIWLSCTRWLGFRLDVGSAAFLAIVAFGSVGLRGSLGLQPGVVGLLLSYVLQLTGLLQWCVRQSAEVENYMVSVERVLEYTSLTPEESPEDIAAANLRAPLPEAWPHRGEVNLKGFSLTYPRTQRPVLKEIMCHIPAGTKVGIVGRTGAGKSSFLQALFRIVNPSPQGSIVIDGIPTSELRLQDLRSRISIIPQEPFLYKGSLRYNLDPFAELPDDKVWEALRVVELSDRVASNPAGLETELAEGGSNWSVGERQLICLARAILRQSRIVVLDEATSNVDVRTDALIEHSIRNGLFANATVLTIAHRLNTVIDYDRIMVLDDGKLVETGSPFELLEKDPEHNECAWFARMVADMGEDARAVLTKVAGDKEIKRRENAASAAPEL
ncbi:P-loop containing nucleoside triphosphate hydrolase protein [Powellomyces hirtus]|nr:P-loop containing nucleoside triphosphate hydrolase protein [Powellomyces hirtus]